jgi:hypothetical protein
MSGRETRWGEQVAAAHSLTVSLPHSLPVLQASNPVPRRVGIGSLKDRQRRRYAYENKHPQRNRQEHRPSGPLQFAFHLQPLDRGLSVWIFFLNF